MSTHIKHDELISSSEPYVVFHLLREELERFSDDQLDQETAKAIAEAEAMASTDIALQARLDEASIMLYRNLLDSLASSIQDARTAELHSDDHKNCLAHLGSCMRTLRIFVDMANSRIERS